MFPWYSLPPSCVFYYCAISLSKHSPARFWGENLGGHVCGDVNLVGELGHGNLEPTLNLVEDFLVGLRGDEGNSESLGSEASGTSDTVEVLVRVVGHIVVDDDVDALDIDTASEKVG